MEHSKENYTEEHIDRKLKEDIDHVLKSKFYTFPHTPPTFGSWLNGDVGSGEMPKSVKAVFIIVGFLISLCLLAF